MRILIILPSQDPASGNWVTAQRFQQGLQQRGHLVTLHGTPLQPQGALRERVQKHPPDVVLLLHAYRAGRPWLEEAGDIKIPYVVLLTGTDVNHGLDAPGQSDHIHMVLKRAAAVLLQNPMIAAGFSARYPEYASRVRHLPAGIRLGDAHYDLRGSHHLAPEQVVFLCPAGLRPVKGLLELLAMSERVAGVSSAFVLAFCGPYLDADYSRRLMEAIASRPWARYLGTIPAPAMAEAMRGVNVIVNNSRSEGLANALLEAAALGIPILASRNPGNAAAVRHNINGFLYGDEAEFQRYAVQLLDRDRRRQLTCPDPERYPSDREAAELAGILARAAAGSPAYDTLPPEMSGM